MRQYYISQGQSYVRYVPDAIPLANFKSPLPHGVGLSHNGPMTRKTIEYELGEKEMWAFWLASLSDLEFKQFPFAASLALNDAMFAARKATVSDYPEHFEGGLNYFRKGLHIEKSSKSQKVLSATIGEATGYMGQQQWGHNKTAKSGGEIAIPTKIVKRMYGTKSGKIQKKGWPSNLTKRFKSNSASGRMGGRGRKSGKSSTPFPMTEPNGRRSIVMRKDNANRLPGSSRYAKGQLVFLYFYVKSAKIKKRLAFDKVVVDTVTNVFAKRLGTRLKKAVETAK